MNETTTPPAAAATEKPSDALGAVLTAVILAASGLITVAWVFFLITLGQWLVAALS